MKRFLCLIGELALVLLPLVYGWECRAVPAKKLDFKVLKSLNRPRGGHALVVNGEEVLVVGGHTTGFVPIASAERFDGRGWALIPMNFTHDFGFAARLPGGDIMVGGGCAESFGIGQSWGVERYLSRERRFEPVGIMSRKRALCRAASLPDGQVVLSGNWYAPDALEVYVPGKGFQPASQVSQNRNHPWLLSKADGTIYAVGSMDNYEVPLDPVTADCLDGTSFDIPLLQEWRLLPPPLVSNPEQDAISDHAWLLPALHKDSGQAGIVYVNGADFSILPLEEPVPMQGVNGADILWSGTILVRRSIRHAYWVGSDDQRCLYILDIDYDAALYDRKAGVTLFYTSPLGHGVSESAWGLLPDGNILMAGGISRNNFSPLSDTILLRLGEQPSTAWHWAWLLLLPLIAGVWLSFRKRPSPIAPEVTPVDQGGLMARMTALMEEQELFRQPGLRIADIAALLGTNTTYISAALNGESGESFFQFITSYRIRYAKKLMQLHPDKLMSEVAEESGFYSDRSFFRNFKAMTGMTPSEWKYNGDQD